MTKDSKTPLYFLVILMLLFTPKMTMALDLNNAITYTVKMQKQPQPSSGNKTNANRDGNRIPPRPIICTISETDGIQIDLCNDDIYAYEVWNETAETCFASYNDETDFVQYLFSVPGTYQIKLITEEYVYTGCISTL